MIRYRTLHPALGLRGLARALLVAAFAVTLWQAVVWLTGVPPFILPGPQRVFASLWSNKAMIADHAVVTFAQILVGLVIGAALGIATALHLALSPAARRFMRPVLVFAQAVPVFALAPILTLWLGYGAGSKVAMVVIIIYFPVAAALFDGLMRTPTAMLDLADVMGAGALRQLVFLRLPHAMPALGTGLRLAAVYAPFGAVIGEWVGASRGLGYLMLLANGRAQTDLMFASLAILALFTVLLYSVVDRGCAGLARRFAAPVG